MKYVLIIMTIALMGCVNTDVYGEIDPNDMTILVPPGNGRLVRDCKKILQKCGWKTIVKSRNHRFTEFSGNTSDSYDIYKVRYELRVYAEYVDLGLDFSPRINFSFTLIDNETGEEVFASGGTGSQRAARNRFKQLIGCSVD